MTSRKTQMNFSLCTAHLFKSLVLCEFSGAAWKEVRLLRQFSSESGSGANSDSTRNGSTILDYVCSYGRQSRNANPRVIAAISGRRGRTSLRAPTRLEVELGNDIGGAYQCEER